MDTRSFVNVSASMQESQRAVMTDKATPPSATEKSAQNVERIAYAMERLDEIRSRLGAPQVAELQKVPVVPEPMPRLLASLDRTGNLAEQIHDALTFIEQRL